MVPKARQGRRREGGGWSMEDDDDDDDEDDDNDDDDYVNTRRDRRGKGKVDTGKGKCGVDGR